MSGQLSEGDEGIGCEADKMFTTTKRKIMIDDMITQVWDGLYEEEERLPEMLAEKEELLESAGIKV